MDFFAKINSFCKKTSIRDLRQCSNPVDTRRFNVYKASIRRQQRASETQGNWFYVFVASASCKKHRRDWILQISKFIFIRLYLTPKIWGVGIQNFTIAL